MPALHPNSFVDRQQHREVGRRARARHLMQHFRRNPLGWCAQIALVAGSLSCGGGGDDSITDPKPTRAAVASVVVSQDTATLVPSATIQLAATAKDATGQSLPRDIIWTASDTSKVGVSPSGLVTATHPGSTLVTATSENHSASTTITVLDGGIVSTTGTVLLVHNGVVQLGVPSEAVAAQTALFASPSTDTTLSARVIRGTSFDFGPSGTIFAKPVALSVRYDASVLPEGTNESALQLYVRGKSSWQVVDGSVIDVQAKTVTASITHFSTYAILVSGAVATVAVGPMGSASGDSAISAVVGSHLQLSATLQDVDRNALTGHVVAWSTSDSTVGTVSLTGVLSILKAGTTTITATSEGKSGSLRVTGNLASVASIGLTGMWPFAANATSRFFAELRDANGSVLTGRVVSWASSTPSVATIAQDGLVTGVAAGTTTITATCEGVTASTVITLTAALSAVRLVLVTPQPIRVRSSVPFPAQTVVAVADSTGNIVREAGRVVTVSYSRPRGRLSGTLTETTGMDGKATFSDLVLADTVSLYADGQYDVGVYNLDFASAGLAGVSPLVELSSGLPAHLYANSSTSLTAHPGASLGPLQVQLKDADGNPVFNVPVTFAPTPATGISVTGPATVPTSADGVAQIEGWTAGPNVGVDSLLVSAAGMTGSPAVFVVNIVPVPRILTIATGAGNQVTISGGTVPLEPSVAFTTESDGHPIAGASVTFTVTSGGGSVTFANSITDSTGRATAGAWTLGSGVGSNSLRASVSTDTGTVAFAATAVAPFTLKNVVAGGERTCGVSPANVAYCWGANSSGQVGDGSTTDRSRPVAVASGLPFSSISVGSSFGLHTCALTTAGLGYCWGRNDVGQLGDGTMTASLVPVPVAGGLTFQSISAGSDHTCGLTAAGEAYCWGDNADYQLGGGMSTDKSAVPRAVPGGLTFRNISAGDKYTCGVTLDGSGYCWGLAGDSRDLGQGDMSGAVVQDPAPIMGGIVFQTISAGSEHTCGISTTFVAYCWGHNTYGELGTSVAVGQKSGFPLPVRSGETFVSIAAGFSHTCAVTTAGVPLCWGDNFKGDVAGAPPQPVMIDSPTVVLGASHFIGVSSGLYYSCGTTAVATYCWGSNSRGQIGDESVTSRSQIVPVHIP